MLISHRLLQILQQRVEHFVSSLAQSYFWTRRAEPVFVVLSEVNIEIHVDQ